MTDSQPERSNFLYRDEIDPILLRVFTELGPFSHEEASSLFHLLKSLTRNSNRPFTPFYDDGDAINRQVRKGWLLQTRIRPPRFEVNKYALSPNDIDNKVRKIFGRVYETFEKLVNDIAESTDKKSYLKHLEVASVAYDKLPENLKIGYIMNYGVEEEEARELLCKIEEYVQELSI